MIHTAFKGLRIAEINPYSLSGVMAQPVTANRESYMKNHIPR